MVIVQVNDVDLPGRRFNGYDLINGMTEYGHDGYQIVFFKSSSDERVRVLSDPIIRQILIDAEIRNSMYNLLLPYGRILAHRPEFKDADVVHYHLIHNHIISLTDFPALTAVKPSVWTWHDLWAITGHCIHPLDCKGWERGCEPCPHLDYHFPLRKDTAGQLWRIKEKIYKSMDVDIVISSKFMLDYVKKSPLGQHFSRIHMIPFGVRETDFGIMKREEARHILGIPIDNFVLAFRCEMNELKGTQYIFKMLKMLKERRNVTLLTVGFMQLPKWVKSKYHCVELGWQNSSKVISAFYSACDVFLMPSIAESFGLMAVEAMASSRPVIVFEGTVLQSITFAPECGVAVPFKSAKGLMEAVERLRANPLERHARGEKGRQLVMQHYRFSDYVKRHISLYEELVKRKRK